MASTLDHLAQLLNATLDAQHHRKGKFRCLVPQTNTKQPRHPPCRKPADPSILGPGRDRLTDTCVDAAENALKEEAKKPKYSLSLLSIVSTAAQPLKTRLAAALAFKNFIRHNYVVCTTSHFSDNLQG